VRTLWPSFEHAEAFERACRALRLVQVGDDALHSVRDLGLFLKAVSYCEEHWDAMEALDRVEERRIDCTGLLPHSPWHFPGDATTSFVLLGAEFSRAVRKLGILSRAGREMSDDQIARAFASVGAEGVDEAEGGRGGGAGRGAAYVSFEEACCWMVRQAVGGAILSRRQEQGKDTRARR